MKHNRSPLLFVVKLTLPSPPKGSHSVLNALSISAWLKPRNRSLPTRTIGASGVSFAEYCAAVPHRVALRGRVSIRNPLSHRFEIPYARPRMLQGVGKSLQKLSRDV